MLYPLLSGCGRSAIATATASLALAASPAMAQNAPQPVDAAVEYEAAPGEAITVTGAIAEA